MLQVHSFGMVHLELLTGAPRASEKAFTDGWSKETREKLRPAVEKPNRPGEPGTQRCIELLEFFGHDLFCRISEMFLFDVTVWLGPA